MKLRVRRRSLLIVAATAAAAATVVGGAWWRRRKPVPARAMRAAPSQPDQRWDDDSTWAFDPPPDPFSPGALLDLRSLNEKVAGEHGFVRVGSDGGFVRGDGQPIRFWAVNSDVAREPFVAAPLGPKSAPDLARHACFLAKRGVNLVRQHRQISPNLGRDPGAAITDIDEVERDAIWRAVAAYRKEGIYSAISPYWSMPMKFAPGWGIAGGHEQSALGLLFFDETLQAAYKTWLKKLLTEPNPHTGLPLALDPSVALIQLQNEDSLLFWTVNGIEGPQRLALEARFGRFVARKHGSIGAALQAWDRARVDGDAPETGRLSLVNLWELTQPSPRAAGRAARLADQTEFYARTMHDFNRDVTDHLKNELGVRSLVNAGNWKTASAHLLGDTERWSYTAADVDATNRYTGGIHQGREVGWAILNGDRYTSDSVLLNPTELPINLKQTQGRPILVTEGAWVMPNGHAAEGPFLIAAYAALTGLAGYCWFATRDEGWTQPGSANGYLPSQAKWIFGTPEMLGSFPAAALAYRMGYLRRGRPVVNEQRSLADLWSRRAPLIAEEASFDPNRDAGDAASRSGLSTSVPEEAFLVGPVQVAFGGDPEASNIEPFGPLIGIDDVRANTGEITLNHAQGWVRVDAPCVQGVAAHFVSAPEHRLRDVTFNSGNSFGTALAVSLDGEPLATSRRILLQFATQSRPTGWVDKPATLRPEGGGEVAGREIVSFGQAPWRVVKARLDVEIRNPGLMTATVLDMNGQAAGPLSVERDAGGVRLRWPQSSMYVVLADG